MNDQQRTVLGVVVSALLTVGLLASFGCARTQAPDTTSAPRSAPASTEPTFESVGAFLADGGAGAPPFAVRGYADNVTSTAGSATIEFDLAGSSPSLHVRYTGPAPDDLVEGAYVGVTASRLLDQLTTLDATSVVVIRPSATADLAAKLRARGLEVHFHGPIVTSPSNGPEPDIDPDRPYGAFVFLAVDQEPSPRVPAVGAASYESTEAARATAERFQLETVNGTRSYLFQQGAGLVLYWDVAEFRRAGREKRVLEALEVLLGKPVKVSKE